MTNNNQRQFPYLNRACAVEFPRKRGENDRLRYRWSTTFRTFDVFMETLKISVVE